jgi:predicted RNA polymerase sigma factor
LRPSGIGPAEQDDDTLLVLSRCCHPLLSPAAAIALTLRAVGGLTTAQIAQAFLVPEPTIAQRISRAKRTVSGERFERPGDVLAVLRVLYLIFNEGFTGEVDLAVEAIRLTRQLAGSLDDPEVAGLLALMLLHHARRRLVVQWMVVSCRCPIRIGACGIRRWSGSASTSSRPR